MVRCLVLVKMYVNGPKKILNRISENGEMNRDVLPTVMFPISFFEFFNWVHY
jgi:hypothetical protein